MKFGNLGKAEWQQTLIKLKQPAQRHIGSSVSPTTNIHPTRGAAAAEGELNPRQRGIL
jgi:hypothetical protein